ncbi:uncharacterized protein PAC_08776 [Phialocephala subalpina]|uniref:RAVE subunit 2/Rogdi n=1 Tax=Phialocephala subalpina TaxID=576137 RepID=A0A1L7X1I0_9HELO|nr:uncharacterized protein PAC_08776 [Phialocephala subalpina]
MATSVWPPLPAHELKAAEDESSARELNWLLDSLQETLTNLKSGLEECYALLAPIEPGSTLVLSSPRSESIKGHVTRVGSRIVKGTLHLKLKTHPPIVLSLSPTDPIVLAPLSNLRTLLNQALDCIDITRWTGDRHSAPFISSQLRLLHGIILEALSLLKGNTIHTHHPSGSANSSTSTSLSAATGSSSLNLGLGASGRRDEWTIDPPSPLSFSPALPSTLALNLTLCDSSLLLTIRVLEPTSKEPNTFAKFATLTGMSRRLEHDEMDQVFTYRGEEVRVREKVRVESSADPSLLSVGAKLGQIERVVESCRGGLGVVMGKGEED